MTGAWRTLARSAKVTAFAAFTLLPGITDAQTIGAPTELEVPSYRSELERIAQSIQHSEQIPRVRKSLPRTWLVRVGDRTVEVSTAWLASDLKKLEENPGDSSNLSQEITVHIAAMRKVAAGLESGSSPANFSAARTQLDKILSAREFGAAQGPSQWDLLKARIARWINEQVYKLLHRLHLGAKGGNALAWVIVGIAFVALCYWVWRTLYTPKGKLEVSVEGLPPSDDPRQWARDALAAADRGDFREAVHCAYWAAVVHLESRGVLKRDRARTPRESLRLLDPHPTEQNLLREFTRHFELIWYGYRPATATEWSEARSHLEKMGCLTPSTPATANS
jgi:uncharacterized protein DUF4129